MDKSYLINLTAFHDDLTSLMDERAASSESERAVIYLDCKKALDIVFHNVLTDREDEVQPI